MKEYPFLFVFIVISSCYAQKRAVMIPEVDNKMTVSNSGKYYLETFKDSYYMILKSFYSNGNIKRKGINTLSE
ncbi:hypothetical protein BBH99_16795 [Chryseobacterium contaminans]|uniref:Uncharacterized protein n=2 Tax=Chryseobacterium contaminans TaxID=1423959 RepID=A0ABX2X9I1_9FLAO|nr:hypothetical protein BBH99_16795 [Chryseobacterium contaminans]